MDPVQSTPTASQPKNNSIRPLVLLICALLIAVLSSFGTYMYLSTQRTQSSYNQPTYPSPTYVAQQMEPTQTVKKSEDSQVIDAAKAFCEAQVDAKGNPRTFALGKSGPDQKEVLYSQDRNFAKLNASCQSTEEAGQGSAKEHILKKVNESWVHVFEGQQENPTEYQKYGIPSEFN